jgi:hypothetical protein
MYLVLSAFKDYLTEISYAQQYIPATRTSVADLPMMMWIEAKHVSKAKFFSIFNESQL